MITVGRPINGISLNGDEFILDENNLVMEFEDKQAAYQYLREFGNVELTDKEMEDNFNFYTEGIL